jgi:hypothetical protein
MTIALESKADAFRRPLQTPPRWSKGIAVDGNSGRNMLRGPTFKDADLAIPRDFRLSRFREGMALQLRADA